MYTANTDRVLSSQLQCIPVLTMEGIRKVSPWIGHIRFQFFKLTDQTNKTVLFLMNSKDSPHILDTDPLSETFCKYFRFQICNCLGQQVFNSIQLQLNFFLKKKFFFLKESQGKKKRYQYSIHCFTLQMSRIVETGLG